MKNIIIATMNMAMRITTLAAMITGIELVASGVSGVAAAVVISAIPGLDASLVKSSLVLDCDVGATEGNSPGQCSNGEMEPTAHTLDTTRDKA